MGWQTLGVPEQSMVPAAENAYRLPSPEPTYTTPFATAGEASIWLPVTMVLHRGWHTLGTPEHPVVPFAENAYSFWSRDPTYTTPFATAGEETTSFPVEAVHRGWHTLGAPEQLSVPITEKAYSFPSYELP